MAFETFKRQRFKPGDDPLVTIQRKGVLSLNRASFKALGDPQAVELLWDPDQRLMGLRKVDPSVEHSYPVRELGRGATWLVSGTAFTAYYGIETPEARRYKATLDGEILVLDLKKPGFRVQAGRTKRAVATTV